MEVAARPEFALEAGGSIDAQWAALWARSGAVPFAHPGWVHAWCAANGAQVRLAAVRRSGGLVAALPLTVARGRLGTPADWHTPVIEAVAADEAALHELAAGLAALSPVAMSLDFVEAGSPTVSAVTGALRSAGYRVATRMRMQSPFIDLSGGARAYFGGLAGGKLRELRRRGRRLAESGEVSFEVGDGGAGLDALLDEAFAVEAAGWKGAAGTAIASDRRVEGMYRSVAAWAASQGMLAIGALRLDGRIIAVDLAIESRGVHYLLKTGFRPDARRFAPAMQLRARMIERAFDLGFERYDFAGTNDPWKMEWTDAVRPIVRVDAYAPTAPGLTARLRDETARLAHRVRKRLTAGKRRPAPQR